MLPKICRPVCLINLCEKGNKKGYKKGYKKLKHELNVTPPYMHLCAPEDEIESRPGLCFLSGAGLSDTRSVISFNTRFSGYYY